jgi:hypothetical protein
MNQTPKLDEWQEVEEKIPVEIPAFSVDDHNNLKFEGMQTVERTMKKRVAYTHLIPHTFCEPGTHNFIILNEGKRIAGRVEVHCEKCEIGVNYIVGLHKIENGKIIVNPL